MQGGAAGESIVRARQQARIQKGAGVQRGGEDPGWMKIEFLPARASTLTRDPVFVCMGSGRKLNGHCDFSWGSPGPNQPRQSGPCN